jgi:hypothetical protein
MNERPASGLLAKAATAYIATARRGLHIGGKTKHGRKTEK